MILWVLNSFKLDSIVLCRLIWNKAYLITALIFILGSRILFSKYCETDPTGYVVYFEKQIMS